MNDSADRLPTGGFAPLVPELDVFDLTKSKAFWCDVLGFRLAYQRPEHGFVFVELQGSQVMLIQRNGNWETGDLECPLGRGINFQIFVESVAPLLDALKEADWPLFRECHDAWYRIAGEEQGSRQFLVQDPDGYPLRFAQDLGKRNAIPAVDRVLESEKRSAEFIVMTMSKDRPQLKKIVYANARNVRRSYAEFDSPSDSGHLHRRSNFG